MTDVLGIVCLSAAALADEEDKHMEPVYQDGKKHSGLLEGET